MRHHHEVHTLNPLTLDHVDKINSQSIRNPLGEYLPTAGARFQDERRFHQGTRFTRKTYSGKVMATWESLGLGGHQCPQPMVRNVYDMSHNFGFRQVNKPYDQKCES